MQMFMIAMMHEFTFYLIYISRRNSQECKWIAYTSEFRRDHHKLLRCYYNAYCTFWNYMSSIKKQLLQLHIVLLFFYIGNTII